MSRIDNDPAIEDAAQASRLAAESLPAQPARAVEFAERALALLGGSTGSVHSRARALRHLGIGRYFLGEHAAAAEAFTKALHLARSIDDAETETSALNGLSAVFHALGDLEGSLKCLEEVLGVAQRVGHVSAEAAALVNLANLHQDLGDFAYAIQLYSKVLGQPAIPADFRATALNNRANALRRSGDLPAARAGHEEALAFARADGLLQREPMILGHLAETLLASGEPDRAERLLAQALDLAVDRSLRRDRYKLLYLLGDARSMQADPTGALQRFREALDCAVESNNPRDESEALGRIVGLEIESLASASTTAYWKRLDELQRRMRTADVDGRAQAIAVRLQLQQVRRELQDASRTAERMRASNARLEEHNRSLKLAIEAFGIQPGRVRAKPGAASKNLTAREQQVLRLMATGRTNPAIGESLGLTRLTVRHYVSSILRKLNVESRTQAVAVALRDGLIDDAP